MARHLAWGVPRIVEHPALPGKGMAAACAAVLAWQQPGRMHEMTRDMAEMERIRADLRSLLPELRRRYPIRSLALFGSVVRGEHRPDSDVDVLVEFDGAVDLFDVAGLRADLEDRLGRRVDLAQRSLLKPRLASRILAEAQPV
jgi:predicted nucleotidyltransferase